MAITLPYSASAISTRVDPRGRYYAKIEANQLTPIESLRSIMAYKKITAYSESTVLQLLNDLLQGAVELTALDGQTRVLGQMLRVYMGIEGSFPTPILTTTDKDKLKVRTQLLKDMKYPVDGSMFTLAPKNTEQINITGIHYSGETGSMDAIKIGTQTILNGRNLDKLFPLGRVELVYNNEAFYFTPPETGYQPSYNAILLTAPEIGDSQLIGAGPWFGQMNIATRKDVDSSDYELLDTRTVRILKTTDPA